eukprot:1160769-Pelagomonas_calceolata.AAC.12
MLATPPCLGHRMTTLPASLNYPSRGSLDTSVCPYVLSPRRKHREISYPEGLWPVLGAYMSPHTYEPVLLMQLGATAGGAQWKACSQQTHDLMAMSARHRVSWHPAQSRHTASCATRPHACCDLKTP